MAPAYSAKNGERGDERSRMEPICHKGAKMKQVFAVMGFSS